MSHLSNHEPFHESRKIKGSRLERKFLPAKQLFLSLFFLFANYYQYRRNIAVEILHLCFRPNLSHGQIWHRFFLKKFSFVSHRYFDFSLPWNKSLEFSTCRCFFLETSRKLRGNSKRGRIRFWTLAIGNQLKRAKSLSKGPDIEGDHPFGTSRCPVAYHCIGLRGQNGDSRFSGRGRRGSDWRLIVSASALSASPSIKDSISNGF